MAKPAVPGRVKTRLVGELTNHQAAAVHAAMLECVLQRLHGHMPGQLTLALDGQLHWIASEPDPDLRVRTPDGLALLDQGTGDLGERLGHVWRAVGDGPVVFFGVDSPDVPSDSLKKIYDSLPGTDAACGPVDDGGYWCLAARAYTPALLADIDWGTAAVYHQTRDAAQQAGLTLHELPAWHDVDDAEDLAALRQRLHGAHEPALVRLATRLERITQDTNP